MNNFDYSNKPIEDNPIHPKDKKILIIGGIVSACVVVVGLGLGLYVKYGMPAPAPLPVAPVSSTSASSSEYVIPDYKEYDATSSSTNGTADKLIETTDENGNYLKEQEMGKPSAPSEKPTVTNPDDLTNPNSKPTYDKPSYDPDNLQGGEINEKGETYIPGVGWVGDIPEGVGETIGNPGDTLSGNKVGH